MDWFRQSAGFYRHPKTYALCAKVGDMNAGAYVARLWASAAAYENMRGHFPGPEAVEAEAGWRGKPGQLVAALLEVGYLDLAADGLLLHDWADYNGREIQKLVADRMRQRHARDGSPPPDESRLNGRTRPPEMAGHVPGLSNGLSNGLSRPNGVDGPGTPNPTQPNSTGPNELGKRVPLRSTGGEPPACSPDQLTEAWNAASKMADPPLPPVLALGKERLRSLAARNRDPFFRENWRKGIEAVPTSSFCKGENPRGWRANIEWFLRPGSLAKVLEGNYIDPQRRAKPGSGVRAAAQKLAGQKGGDRERA